jgi:hypothetical protein
LAHATKRRGILWLLHMRSLNCCSFPGPLCQSHYTTSMAYISNLINKHTATYPSLISWWWWSSTRSFYMQSYQLLGRIASSRSKNLVLMLMVLKNK